MTIKDYIHKTSNNLQQELCYVELQSENISDVFVTCNKEEEYDNDEESDEIEGELTPVTNVILNNSRIVLLGDPGSGKSTVVTYLVKMFCNRCLNGDNSIIPYLIRLKDIHSAEDWKEAISGILEDNDFSEKLESGNVMLFLDGLNEIPISAYKQIVKEIVSFIQEYDNAPFLVTSRKFGYKSIPGLDEYQIRDFDEIAIKEYIEKRTGNKRLYEEMVRINIISSDTINPLILKMIIDVWEKNGVMPRFRSELYSEYISYQLEKSYPGKDKMHKALISLMEQVAFNMRMNGYISDHEDEVKGVLLQYVKENDVEKVASLMLGSGLLSMDIVSSRFHFISFIHESFQEYLSSLYIANNFKHTGSFCVPIESYVWRDALKSVTEIISREKNDNLMVSLLAAMNMYYMNVSAGEYINEYLEQMISCCQSASKENVTCYSWLFQYLLMQMENYLLLSEENKSDDYFEIIVTSVLRFGNEGLIKRLFTDTRWQNEWLYMTVNELDGDIQLGITRKENILCKAFEHSTNRIAVFKSISTLMSDMECFYSLTNRLGYVEHLAWKLLSSADHRFLYETTGNVKELFHTFDVDYIKSEIESNEDLPLEDSKSLLNPRHMDCCMFYLGEIAPRLAKASKSKKIFGRGVISKIMHNHDIQRLLLKNPLFESFKTEILETFYMIPDDEICQEYYEYIRINRGNLYKEKGLSNIVATFKLCGKVDESHKLFQLCSPTYDEDFNIKEAIENSITLTNNYKIIFFNKYKFYKEHLVNIPEGKYIRDIHDDVFDGKIICIKELNGIYSVYVSTDTPRIGNYPKVLRGDCLRIGNDIIKVKKTSYKSKKYIGVISPLSLLKTKVDISPKQFITNIVIDVKQLSMYRKSELEKLDPKWLNMIGNDYLINYGLISLIPSKCRDVIDDLKLYIVKFVNNDIVVYANDTSTLTVRNKHNEKLEIGDIVYRSPHHCFGSDAFFKIQAPDQYSDLIFFKGNVVPSLRKGLLIKDEESGQMYTNPTITEHIKGRVTFFPVANKKMDGAIMHVAYRVRKCNDT